MLVSMLLITTILIVGMGTVNVAKADGTIYWEGNGSENLPCEYGGYWVLSPAQDITDGTLTVNGIDYPMWRTGNNWKGISEGYLDINLVAYVTYTGDGEGAHLQLSHCTEGNPTSTPTFTQPPPPTNTPTYTSTPTEKPTETPTNTPTETVPPTPTETTSPTPTETVPPTPTETVPPTPTETTPPTPTETVPPTPTETVTQPPTPTETVTQPPTPTETVTQPPTPTETLTQPPTPTEPPTITPTPTETVTVTPTETPTETPTVTPTPSETPTETPTVTPTKTPTQPPYTETPKPPQPAEPSIRSKYPGELLAVMYANKTGYGVYNGVGGPDGVLLLPSETKGGALYNNQLWIHRTWNSGWFKLTKDEIVKIDYNDGTIYYYQVTGSTHQPYGQYFDDGTFHIISCYGALPGTWDGVEVYNLELIKTEISNIK